MLQRLYVSGRILMGWCGRLYKRLEGFLKGSWDVETKVMSKVDILIFTYKYDPL